MRTTWLLPVQRIFSTFELSFSHTTFKTSRTKNSHTNVGGIRFLSEDLLYQVDYHVNRLKWAKCRPSPLKWNIYGCFIDTISPVECANTELHGINGPTRIGLVLSSFLLYMLIFTITRKLFWIKRNKICFFINRLCSFVLLISADNARSVITINMLYLQKKPLFTFTKLAFFLGYDFSIEQYCNMKKNTVVLNKIIEYRPL